MPGNFGMDRALCTIRRSTKEANYTLFGELVTTRGTT
jgi:hypothetical protein